MLGRIFGRKTFLDPDDEDWQIETWAWLLKHLGGLEDLKRSQLVTPTRAFFPSSDTKGHARAEHIFACVKKLARVPHWPCELIAQPERPEAKVGDFAIVKTDSGGLPLGTFRATKETVEITYDPKSVEDPAELVATLAHELAHYILAGIREETPGGEDMHEYATDVMVIYLGFGLFGANRAFNFSQHHDFQSQGWKWSRQGYLRESDWVFGLAIFARLRGENVSAMHDYLKPHLFSEVRKAERYLAANPDLLPA